MRTQELIAALAADARPARSIEATTALALALALVVTTALFLAVLGPRSDIVQAAETIRFLAKPAIALFFTIAALRAALCLAHPVAPGAPWLYALALAPALMLIGVALEMASLPAVQWPAALIGTNALVCLTVVPALAAVPLMALLFALRRGAPMRPALTGAVAGLAAAGLAATLYAFHCTDDSPLFVAVWYTAGTAVVAAVGALIGSRVLRW